MTTNYLNKYMEPVANKQIELLDEYIKQDLINNRIKLEEVYKNGTLLSVTYFLDSEENVVEIKSRFKEIPIELYKNEVIQGNYRKYDVESFNLDGTLVSRSIEVLNDDMNLIYRKSFNIETNDVIYFEKQYIDVENDVTYEFTYNEDGTFKWLSLLDPLAFVDTDVHGFGPNDIGIDKNPYKFSWEGFEYYQFANPIIPE